MDRERAPWETPSSSPPPSPAPSPAQAEARAEKAEQAAIRRRWITLGEVLAVLAVGISGLTLWNSWSERSHQEAERAAESAKARKVSATLVLKATPSKDRDRLDLTPAAADQTVQSQRILFPTRTGVAAVNTTGDAHVEADWFAAAVRKGEHDRDLRLPVAITTRFVAGDGEPTDTTALYHLGYRIDGGLFGSTVRLTGLSLVRRVPAAEAQRRLDAMK